MRLLPHLSRGRLHSAFALLLWGVPVAGTAQAGAPAIRVTTRLVSVDVVVQDASGHIVTGLTAKDFVVKENGREQHIAAFADQTGVPVTNQGVTDTGAKNYQFSNMPEAARGGAVTLILLDLLNTPTQEQLFARKELLRFFERMPAGSRCGLFTLGSSLQVVQNVTANKAELIAAMSRMAAKPANLVRDESAREMAADQTVRAQTAMGRSPAPGTNAPVREAVNDFQERAGDTQEALAELTEATAGYPGRKNLIWLAGSFPVAIGPSLQSDAVTSLPRTLELPGVRDNTAALAGSGIAIYPVSTRGMTSTAAGAEVSGEAEADPSGRSGLRTIEGQVSRQYDLQVSMEHLATLTGGRAFYNTNDLAAAVERSVDEGDHSYRLDYLPENRKWDGAYRHLAVAVRGHGYHLAYRQGYFATEAAHPEAPGTPGLSAQVQHGSLPKSGILLRANVLKPRAPGGETTVEIAIDPASVTFADGADGLRHATLLVLLETVPASAGGASTEKKAVLKLGLEPADYQAVLQSGIPVRQTIAGVTAGAMLRLGVRDLQTGQTGTLRLQ